jgi:hypothetical protein
MTDDNSNRIKELQEQKKKILGKIENLEAVFKEEKDNEECWPGHSSTRYQTADIDRQVLIELLRGIEEEIKKLS